MIRLLSTTLLGVLPNRVLTTTHFQTPLHFYLVKTPLLSLLRLPKTGSTKDLSPWLLLYSSSTHVETPLPHLEPFTLEKVRSSTLSAITPPSIVLPTAFG